MRVRVAQSHFFYLDINFASVLGRGDAHGVRRSKFSEGPTEGLFSVTSFLQKMKKE